MRIVRLANFVAPRSGGLRTALNELGAGYAAAGHEPLLVIPGAESGERETPAGRVISVPGPVVPGTGGYRVIVAREPAPRPPETRSAGGLGPHDAAMDRPVGAIARDPLGHGVAREPRRPLASVRLLPPARSRASARRAGGPAQPGERGRLRSRGLHDGMGGGRVQPPRRAQPGTRAARRRPGPLHPRTPRPGAAPGHQLGRRPRGRQVRHGPRGPGLPSRAVQTADVGSRPASPERARPPDAGPSLRRRAGREGFPVHALPDEEPTGANPSAWASARWLATEGTGWVVRRSRDFLPTLGRLVLSEAWHEIRGQTAVLDDRFHAELDGILRRVDAQPLLA